MNANDRLDYFGRTVNLAARLAKESTGGDVVLLEDVFEEPAVQALLSDSSVASNAFTARLRGVEGEKKLVRLVADPQGNRLGRPPAG